MVQWPRLCSSITGDMGSVSGQGSYACHAVQPKRKTKRIFSAHTSPPSVTPSVSGVKPAVLLVMHKACPPPPLSALPRFLCSSNSGCSLCLECSSPPHAWFFPSLLETKQDVMGLLGTKAFLRHLVWVPKGRFKHLLIRQGRKCRDKGGAVKKE